MSLVEVGRSIPERNIPLRYTFLRSFITSSETRMTLKVPQIYPR
jgi:hypothetical protein